MNRTTFATTNIRFEFTDSCVCAYVYCPIAQVENSSFHAEDINLLSAVLKVLMIIILAWGAGILGVVNYRQVHGTGNAGQRD